MDKIEQLYKLYLEQGLITSATSLENFSGASDEQRAELYKLGGTKNLFSTTDLDTFKSAWTKKPAKTEAVAAETVPVAAQKKAVDTGLKSEGISLEPKKNVSRDKQRLINKRNSLSDTSSSKLEKVSQPVSYEQASFNYEQRTGNKPSSVMDLTDSDYAERGPTGLVTQDNSFRDKRNKIQQIREDRNKLEKRAQVYSYDSMGATIESVDYVKKQLEEFDKAAAVELKVLNIDPDFKLKNEAIEQLSRNTGNNQATGSVADVAGEFNIFNLFKGKSYYKNQEASEIIDLNAEVEDAVVSKLDRKSLEKLAQGFYTLNEKENLINEIKIPIVEKKIEEIKNNNSTQLSITQDEIGGYKKAQKSIVESLKILTNGQMNLDNDPNLTQEKVDEYNLLIRSYNDINKKTEKAASDFESYKAESISKVNSLEGDFGIDLAVGVIGNNFGLSDKVSKFREKYSGEGFWNASKDIFGGELIQGSYQLLKKSSIGAPSWLLTSFGDAFQDDDTYSSFDAFSDVINNWSNKTLVPKSESQKFKITKEEGGFADFDIRNYTKLGVSMIPFTAELISQVKKGKFTGIRSAIGDSYLKLGNKGKVLKDASQQLKNNIITADAAFRATVMDNQKEGESLGLNGFQSSVFAATKSATEAGVALIMPDYQFLNGLKGKAIKDAFIKDLKTVATKEGAKSASKQFATNVFKEWSEEEINAAMNVVTDASYGLALPKASEFLNNQIELTAGTIMLSGGMGTVGAASTFSNQKKLIYSQIHDNIASLDLGLKTMEEASNNIETKEQIKTARQFAKDIAKAIESSPENVTAEQIDLLLEKQKLISKKKTTDSAFHDAINKKIQEVDTKIESSGVKRDIAKQFDKDIKNIGKSLNSIGQKVDETIILEDDQDGSADDKMIDFLVGMGQTKEYAIENKSAYGTFVTTEDGKEILVVNKTSALSNSVVTTGQHEFLHKLLKTSLSSNPDLVKQAGELLLKEIKATVSADSELASRIESYASDTEITDEKFFEEMLPLFSEALTRKDVKLNQPSVKRISDFFRQVFQNLGLKNVKFDSADGVVNFIKDYNKAYSKGVFKGSLKGLAGKDGNISGVSFSKSIADLNTELEELIDNEYEMDEGDFESQKSNLELKIRQAKTKEAKPVAEVSKKPTVKKEGSTKEKAVSSKVYNNESLVETIKSKDSTTREKAKAEADLVDSFDSLALKAIKYDTRKGDYDREDVRDYLREFLPGIIERYDPSESKFSTYVTNTIAPKAQQTYEKFRKIADKSIDAEIGGVGSVKEMSGDINTLYGNETESSGLKESTQKMIKATSFGPISDPAVLEAVENVIDVKESERPNFKSLNNKYFDKVSEAIFGINGKKTRGNASLKYDKSGGSSEANSLQNVFKNDNDVKKFIKTMPDYNIATKETVVNEQGEIIDVSRDTYGRSIGINPKVLAIFYDKVQGAIPGVSSPNGRSLGLTTQTDVYKLKPEFTGNISPASVAKLQSLIGINKGTLSIPIKGEARTEFGSILTGLTKMYIDNVINTVGRSKLDTNQAKADLGAGKSSLMFSKSTLEGKYLTVNQKTTLINTVNSLKSKNTDNDLTNDVWSNIILNIDKSKNLYEVFNSISEVVEVVLTVKGQRTFEQNLLNSLLRSAKIDFKSVILDSFNEYRKIFKYEYRTIGFDFVKSKLKSDISEADSEESKKQVIKNFILFESRSIRTGKIDGIRTNEVLFDKILKELGAEDLGFEVLKKDGRSYITLDKVVLTGMLDITKVKEGFTPKTIALMNSEASSALNHVIKVLKGSALNTAKGYLSLISLDQRGILRKISTPGFEITGFKPNRLILEHETTALSLYKKLIDFVEGNISEKELRDFVSKSKVNLIPETLDNLLNGKNVTAIDKARYSTKEFLDVLNKYKEKGRYKEATSSDIKALKETAVYKKFNKTLDGKKLYHGGSGIIKSPNVNSEDHLTWFYVDVAEAAMDWVEGKTTTSTQQYLYEVDFNSIAEDHVVFPDFELIPYTIIKEAVDKVYPKGGYLPEANNIKNPYGAIEIMKDPKAGKILEEFLKWSLNNNAAYEYYTGDPLIEKGKISEGQAIIVLGEISRDKSKKMSFSKSLNLDKEFNDIIENKTGIASYKEFAAVKAALRGQKKGRFDFFIPPSAEDFVGLLYYTLGKGTVGDSQMKWYKDNLLNPYARAVENITRDRNNLGRDFLALKKDLKIIPKNLKKKTKGGDFTREQAIRVYIWNEIGKDVPGLSKLDLVELVDIVNSDPQLKLFAQEIMKLNKGRAYVSPADGWVTGTITTDLLESLNTTGRKQYLELWKQNVDIIFSEKNLNKLEAAYGKSYRYALENMLHRMETGRNRTYGMDSTTGRFTDWINGSTAAIMFFNTRSALLQTISAVNFINFGDNNVIAAGKAFANQKQYWSDFKLLFNSEFLTERRDGLKININEADIADIAKEKGVRGVINKLLKLGFLPTQIADSFAIASGGSTFYRNRVKSLVKGGMNTEAAEKQAMRDFREIAEESQQSSRPDKISSQQAGPLGRIILAFANTPAQYARIIKKAASDLKNGRGDAKTNLSKILYYGVAQNILFNTLQQAMFAMLFEGDEEDDSILAEKKVKVINGMVDSIARGTGLYGAVFTVVKNASVRIYEQTQKKNPDYRNTYLELLKISPPISSKIQKFASAEKTASWNMKEIKSKGFSLDNPGFLAVGKVISSTTNIPLDRAIMKLNNLKAASDSQVETYKRIALLAGWSEWELGMKKKKEVKSKSTKKSTKVKYWTKSPY